MQSYLSNVRAGINGKNGSAIGSLLSIIKNNFGGPVNMDTAKSMVKNAIPNEAFSTLIIHRLEVLNAISLSNWGSAIENTIAMYIILLDILKDDTFPWMTAVLVSVSDELRRLASQVRISIFMHMQLL